ncbi:hypothetical protein F4780DRAFT_727263 [Xylariomycetidae sp. FL0641]|nr:hypothetical protein F4780DRAFT_727263 [Xylariomycetidae sp. FL0641]
MNGGSGERSGAIRRLRLVGVATLLRVSMGDNEYPARKALRSQAQIQDTLYREPISRGRWVTGHDKLDRRVLGDRHFGGRIPNFSLGEGL